MSHNSLKQQLAKLRAGLKSLFPAMAGGDAEERIRACVGALLGILVTGFVGRAVAGEAGSLPWLIAPMGASAVLLFAVPASPLAQPWSIIGGNLVASIVGVGCHLALPDEPIMAAGVAIGLAIGGMLALRCVHPPSGAVALTAVLGGPAVHKLGLGFVLAPVMLNSFCLLGMAIAFHHLCGRPYPQRARPLSAAQKREHEISAASRAGFSDSDLDEVLAGFPQMLDIRREDLQQLLQQAEAHAYKRRFGEVVCADIMARKVVYAEYATPLDEAWALMREHGIKALPVIDRARRVIGIVTQADFMKHAAADGHEHIASGLRRLLRRNRSTHSDKPEAVGQIMSKPAQTAQTDLHITELVPLLGGDGHSHIPIVDDERRLAGIITQRDLIVALYRGRLEPG
ncbi:MAG: HPP family protein [Rhodocyclaceae bacterium]